MTHAYAQEAVCCEGYGPGGAAVMVTCRVDHQPLRDRARAVLLRHGGSGGAANSVAYLFHRVGILRCPATGTLAAQALAAGAEDLLPQSDGTVDVITDPEDMDTIKARLRGAGFAVIFAVVTSRAAQSVPLNLDAAARLQALITELRAIDGVENVYTNGQIPQQLLAQV